MDLQIVPSLNYSISSLVHEMTQSLFSTEAKIRSLKAFFCPHLKDIQFSVMEEAEIRETSFLKTFLSHSIQSSVDLLLWL